MTRLGTRVHRFIPLSSMSTRSKPTRNRLSLRAMGAANCPMNGQNLLNPFAEMSDVYSFRPFCGRSTLDVDILLHVSRLYILGCCRQSRRSDSWELFFILYLYDCEKKCEIDFENMLHSVIDRLYVIEIKTVQFLLISRNINAFKKKKKMAECNK